MRRSALRRGDSRLTAGAALAALAMLAGGATARAQSLSLTADSSVERGEEFSVTLRGTSAFALSGFVTVVDYDPQRLTCIRQEFATGVWNDADFRIVDDSLDGQLMIVVVEDTTNSGRSVAGGTSRPFADIIFRAGICPSSTFIGFLSAPDSNILVDTAAIGHDLSGGALSGKSITIVPGSSFVRGNANGTAIDAEDGDAASSSTVTIADGLFVLTDLFAQGPAPGCLEAADANDDGRYDIIDAVTILQYLFGNESVSIPEPFTRVGADGSASLGCATAPATIGCS